MVEFFSGTYYGVQKDVNEWLAENNVIIISADHCIALKGGLTYVSVMIFYEVD